MSSHSRNSLYFTPPLPPKSTKSISSLRRSGSKQNFTPSYRSIVTNSGGIKSQGYQEGAFKCGSGTIYTASTESLNRSHYSDDAYSSTSNSSSNNSTASSRVSGSSSKKSCGAKQDKFRDSPEKRKLIKTELCETFPNVHECPFGAMCNYAHNYKELALKTLKERYDNGLIDINTFRTRPCFTFIATGDWYVEVSTLVT